MVRRELRPLSVLPRLYIYAIHGYFTEVMFTAVWNFVVTTDLKLHGCSSVWSLMTHGVGTLIIEQLSLKLHTRVHLVFRGLIYLVTAYLWEFSCGIVLRQFNACPWDYTHFSGDFMGLITLEYAPFWYIGTILAEKVIIKFTRRLYIGAPFEDGLTLNVSPVANGAATKVD